MKLIKSKDSAARFEAARAARVGRLGRAPGTVPALRPRFTPGAVERLPAQARRST